MASPFIASFGKISNRLTSKAIIKYGDKQAEALALWDTGATKSCISRNVIRTLGLVATGYCNVHTPTGKAKKRTYLVDVVLPGQIERNDIEVSESEIGKQGLGLLIGMDIINTGDFAVSNFNGNTEFGFRVPSVENVNLIDENSKAIAAIQKIQEQKHESSDKLN